MIFEGIDHWIPDHAPDHLNEVLLRQLREA